MRIDFGKWFRIGTTTAHFFRWALNAALFAAMFVITAYAMHNYAQISSHPRTVRAIWAEKDEVKPGGELIIMVLADIHTEICQSEVHRWVIRSEDDQVVLHKIEPTPDVKVGGGQSIRDRVPIPADLVPGGYYYKSVVYDRLCDDPTRAFPPTTPAFVYFRIIE